MGKIITNPCQPPSKKKKRKEECVNKSVRERLLIGERITRAVCCKEDAGDDVRDGREEGKKKGRCTEAFSSVRLKALKEKPDTLLSNFKFAHALLRPSVLEAHRWRRTCVYQTVRMCGEIQTRFWPSYLIMVIFYRSDLKPLAPPRTIACYLKIITHTHYRVWPRLKQQMREHWTHHGAWFHREMQPNRDRGGGQLPVDQLIYKRICFGSDCWGGLRAEKKKVWTGFLYQFSRGVNLIWAHLILNDPTTWFTEVHHGDVASNTLMLLTLCVCIHVKGGRRREAEEKQAVGL